MDNKEAEGNSEVVEVAIRIVKASQVEQSVSSERNHGALVEGPAAELRERCSSQHRDNGL